MSIRVDRTYNANLWKPFEYGHKYELREDLFLITLEEDGKRNELALVPSSDQRLSSTNCYESSGYYSAPASIQAYQSDSTNWMNVAGIARAGTFLEPSRLDRFYQFSLWYGAETPVKRYATLLSGYFTGTVVNIEDLHWNAGKYLKRK